MRTLRARVFDFIEQLNRDTQKHKVTWKSAPGVLACNTNSYAAAFTLAPNRSWLAFAIRDADGEELHIAPIAASAQVPPLTPVLDELLKAACLALSKQ